MVARLVWDQDAAGSNPVTSTTPAVSKSRTVGVFYAFTVRPALKISILSGNRSGKLLLSRRAPHFCGVRFILRLHLWRVFFANAFHVAANAFALAAIFCKNHRAIFPTAVHAIKPLNTATQPGRDGRTALAVNKDLKTLKLPKQNP